MDLYEAATHGSIDAIKSAAERGCDINGRDKDGKTPLWLAAQNGRVEACRFLVARGAGMEAQNRSILEVAVEGGHADVVALLWSHCDAAREHRSLESAISLGFHEIADFLIEMGRFEYLDPEITNSGFPERMSTAFQQWERFLFVRRGQELPLHHIFWDYALLLAAKADRNAGLRLVEFLLGESMADANSKIMVKEKFETPLTAAAENGNLEILAALMDHPNTNVTICGKYDWPAFLHLLASPLSISTERGRAIARQLCYEAPSNRFFTGGHQKRYLERAFDNVLRFGDDGLVKQVIDLVHGEAGILILPLLIRVNEADGVKWVLNSDAVSSSRPPPAFWVLLCQYFERYEDRSALELFTRVAEFLVEKKIWNQLIPKCLSMRNFSFIQQFFYVFQAHPKEVTEKTLLGLGVASSDESLIKEWADQEFASAALWNAIHCGLWSSPAFERLLFNCSAKNLNGPDPHCTYRGRREPVEISHALFSDLFPDSEAQRIPVRFPPAFPAGPDSFPANPDSHDIVRLNAQAQAQVHLMLLEQQNKRRLILPRETKSPLSWAILSRNITLLDALLLSPQVNVNSKDNLGRTPLMYAIGVNNRPIVEILLNHRNIDLNLGDDEGRTAIFYSIEAEDLDMVRLLVGTRKVDYSIRNKSGQTVQDFAKKTKKKREIVTALSS